jgi:predicted DNA binding protein
MRMADITTPATAGGTDAAQPQPAATLVRGRLPTEAFALGETFSTIPSLSVTGASFSATGEAAIMPLLWFQTTDETLVPTLDSDPTVASATELVRTDDRRLYRMEWSPDIRSLCQLLLSSQAILQDASATANHWTVEILYPDRETLSQTSAYYEQYDLSFEIESVRTLDPDQPSQYGLTPPQYETLMVACKRGYFAVPREITLETLAAEMGVSHQALSERLRRAHQTLITAVLKGTGSNASSLRC